MCQPGIDLASRAARGECLQSASPVARVCGPLPCPPAEFNKYVRIKEPAMATTQRDTYSNVPGGLAPKKGPHNPQNISAKIWENAFGARYCENLLGGKTNRRITPDIYLAIDLSVDLHLYMYINLKERPIWSFGSVLIVRCKFLLVEILWMEEILHQLIGGLSQYL